MTILQFHWQMIASSHIIVIADVWSSIKIVGTYTRIVATNTLVVCNQMYLYNFIIGGEINDENHKVSEVNLVYFCSMVFQSCP